jgi:LPXTG-motif cell wall-anchored protein
LKKLNKGETMKKLLLVAGLMLTALGGAVTAASPAAAVDLGVHHPDCAGLVKDIEPGAPTPVDGVVYVKAGNVHYDVGFRAAGYVAPPPGANAVSHVDVCPTEPEVTTTTEPEVTTTTESEVTTTTEPEVTTTTEPEVTTTTEPEVTTTTEPEVTTTEPEAVVGGDGGTVPTTDPDPGLVAGDTGTLPATGPSQTTGMALMAMGFLLTGLAVVAMTRRPEDEPLI